MFARILSAAVIGVEGYPISIEIDTSQGLPSFDIVGLPSSSIRESKERVRTAIKNCNYPFPIKKITVNLSPATMKKEGTAFDLPIAVGVLVCNGVLSREDTEDVFICGELSLDGNLRPIKGILSMISCLKNNSIEKFILPFENKKEAELIDNIKVIAVKNLSETVDVLKNGFDKTAKTTQATFSNKNIKNSLDFSDVKGQFIVKRALEISASGGHNMLMIGPPGSGKTMMAKRFPSILPELSFEESIEVSKIYSIVGMLKEDDCLITERPFRSPHHTVSYSALSGGGRIPRPGEISLAHKGVLFLDELPEFHRNVLEILRQPLEDGFINISRASGISTYPSEFLLLASMNPCPCGFYGSENKCSCSQNEVDKYLSKISGPLLDRIDIHCETLAVNYSELETSGGDSSRNIRTRVLNAVSIQNDRYKNEDIKRNSLLTPSLTEKYCKIGAEENSLLKQAFDNLGLSVRAYHKILKLSRTIADLNSSENIKVEHIAEAIQYRSLDRKYRR